MKKIKIITVFVLASISLLLASNLIKDKVTVNKKEKNWSTIDSLKQVGKFQEAYSLCIGLLDTYHQRKDEVNFLKAFIYSIDLTKSFAEDPLLEQNNLFLKWLPQSIGFKKNILLSLRAEHLQSYLYKDYNSNTSYWNNESENPNDWSIEKIKKEITQYFFESLKDLETTDTITLFKLEPILQAKRENRELKPTLSDLLTWKAINYFEAQKINDEDYLDILNTPFNKYSIKDTSNPLLITVYLYQNLIKINEQKTEPLIYNQIEYFKYLYKNSFEDDKDSVYEAHLKNLINKYNKQDVIVLAYNELAKHYMSNANKNLPEKRWNNKLALVITHKAIKNFPQSKYLNDTKNINQTILAPQLNIKTQNTWLTDQNIYLNVEYKNTQKLHYRIYSLPQFEWEEPIYYYKKEQLKSLLKQKPIITQTLDLPDAGDYLTHNIICESKPLSPGKFILIASDSEDLENGTAIINQCVFTVTNLLLTVQNLPDYRTLLVVTDKKIGKPIAGAKVDLYSINYNYQKRKDTEKLIESLTTDENGFALVNEVSDGYNFVVKIKKENDFVSQNINLSGKQYYPRDEFAKSKILTDRVLYRPGQKVYIKGIVYEKKLNETNLLINHTLTLQLTDVNGQTVATANLRTNEYGSYVHEFEIPKNCLNGTFWISDGYGSKDIQIEEYKRPKFEIEFKNIETETKLNHPIVVKATARAMSGMPLNNAKAQITLYRNIYAYHQPWYRGTQNLENKKLIETISLNSNDTGGFIYSFKPQLKTPLLQNQILEYIVKIRITDINGETYEKEKRIAVNKEGFVTHFNFGEQISNPYNIEEATDTTELKVETTTTDQIALNKNLKIRLTELNLPDEILDIEGFTEPDTFVVEYRSVYEKFINRNPNNWKALSNQTQKEIQSNTNYRFNQLFSSNYGINKIEIIDSAGNIIFKKIIHIIQSKKPENSLAFFKAKSDKSFYRPGEELKLNLYTYKSGGHIFYTLEELKENSNARELKYGWIKTNNQQAILTHTIKEIHKGNFFISLFYQVNGKTVYNQQIINVPRIEKELKIEAKNIRENYFPGSTEKWIFSIKDYNNKPIISECLATAYDASLDQILPHKLNSDFFENNYPLFYLNLPQQQHIIYSDFVQYPALKYYPHHLFIFDQWLFEPLFNNHFYYRGAIHEFEMAAAPAQGIKAKLSTPTESASVSVKKVEIGNKQLPTDASKEEQYGKKEKLTQNQIRQDFKETAFFIPNLLPDREGNITVNGSLPESITKWKMMVFAHGKELESGYSEFYFKTNKPIMVSPNLPRTLREGDQIVLKTKIDNATNQEQTVEAKIKLEDGETNANLNQLLKSSEKQTIKIKPNSSAEVSWPVSLNKNINLLKITIEAANKEYADAEVNYLPVLSNRVLITEALPIVADSSENTFVFQSLLNNQSKTLKNISYTLEYTSNPLWNVLKYLPYLMEYPYECNEQIFSRYFSNSIALKIVNDNPEFEKVLTEWNKNSKQSLMGKLANNSELKDLLLGETPWVLQNKSEEEQKANLAKLFDKQRLENELQSNLNKLIQNQTPNGGWGWFNGMRDDEYITAIITQGLYNLQNGGIIDFKNYPLLEESLNKALNYLSKRLIENYAYIQKNYKNPSDYRPGQQDLRLISILSNRQVPKSFRKKEFAFFVEQAKRYWLVLQLNEKINLAKTLFYLEDAFWKTIIASIEDNAIKNKKTGFYWKENVQQKVVFANGIETHANAIELFYLTQTSPDFLTGLYKWLILNNRSNYWSNTKTTTKAIYSLLLISGKPNINNVVNITIGNSTLKLNQTNTEAGTGYFKKSFNIEQDLTKLSTIKINQPDKNISYGALYWQYTDQLENINKTNSDLSIDKKYFVRKIKNQQEVWEPISIDNIKLGDEIKVQLQITTLYPIEYVHIKDYRASGLEPYQTVSGMRYENQLSYYSSVSDAAMNFFIPQLTKGTYTFSYTLKANNIGEFSSGIANIQCMYSPELTGNSGQLKIKVN